MPPKSKRGKTINLTDFNGPQEDVSNTWAEDAWNPEDAEVVTMEVRDEKDGKNKIINMGINSKLGDFRSEETAQLSTVVPPDMEPPYTAHVGNLTHGITEEELKEAFFPNEIISTRVLKTKGTFAFIEFENREQLQNAIFFTGKFIKGRQIKVDVATKQQQERMAGGNAASAPGFELSRDAIGSGQQPTWDGPRDERPARSPVGELSRDVFGGRQGDAPAMGGAPARGGGGFGDFNRDEMGSAQQPEFKPQNNWRSSPKGTPKGTPNTRAPPAASGGSGGFGSWRDDAPQEQPKARKESKSEEPAKPAKASEPAQEKPAAAPANTFSWRDAKPLNQPPAKSEPSKRVMQRVVAPTSKPAEPTTAASRFGDFRK